jgi:hypothetical protein
MRVFKQEMTFKFSSIGKEITEFQTYAIIMKQLPVNRIFMILS